MRMGVDVLGRKWEDEAEPCFIPSLDFQMSGDYVAGRSDVSLVTSVPT
jgi:hypothetical protein